MGVKARQHCASSFDATNKLVHYWEKLSHSGFLKCNLNVHIKLHYARYYLYPLRSFYLPNTHT
jgi:hypothetical protein